ncbi:tRNA (adenosine(37)-N6)-threonylcarbamoyltransferase complex ATPase subunit type 1 TsaE [Dendrosporobacter sp. 1207_IL3150]|uniref:tRNA (adenosine(37)-N6)-threonylcarbamoyltransferase complex ATPase subunit type 1 TsaE n=1 Tax=Dendrosporobacter sp. 1207_IL3150 TaxID=3084054 RepID=UPI002FDA5366
MFIFKTCSPEETFDFGRQIAKHTSDGFKICLKGDLGAGKTLLVQGIAAELKATDDVTSPTFSILNIYNAKLTIYHFDLYRLDRTEELFDIGFYEYINCGGLTIIEWPDKFIEEMPQEHLWIEIKPGDITTERLIEVKSNGVKYQQVCEELKTVANSCFRYGHPCV